MWSHLGVSFNNMPFEKGNPRWATLLQEDIKLKRMYNAKNTQIIIGFHAHRLYPEYVVSPTEGKHLKSRQVKDIQEAQLHALKRALTTPQLSTKRSRNQCTLY